jgi:hypothetical protein
MKRALLILIASLLLVTPAAAKFDPWAGPKLIAVFAEFNPWLTVIGSDTPRVAVYENGDVIFVKKVGNTYAYHKVTLKPDELAALAARWQTVFSVTPPNDGYEVSNATDQTSAVFYLRRGEKAFRTGVYGWGCERPIAAPVDAQAENRPPPALAEAHKMFCTLDFPASQEWVPQYVEVMLWDYSYAPEASISWPKDWPGLDSPRAMQRGNSWSIFLDGSHLPALRKFVSERREKGAVELGGKKWAIDFRYTFPSEPQWRGGQ